MQVLRAKMIVKFWVQATRLSLVKVGLHQKKCQLYTHSPEFEINKWNHLVLRNKGTQGRV